MPKTEATTSKTELCYQASTEANPNDIVEAILRTCLEMAPGFSAAVAAAVDQRIRAEWGSENVYVPQFVGGAVARQTERNQAIKRDHQRGEHVELLARRYQLTTKRIRQILAG